MIELERVEKEFVVRRRRGRVTRERTVVRAVQDLSFAVDAGELVGYVGPNGAASPPR
jgi:ABC-2 type transport system ATP-binding protein